MKKIALIGLGPHAKRIYYKFIENDVLKNTLFFSILVELESKKKEVECFFENKVVKPKYILYVPDKGQIVPKNINGILKHNLDKIIEKSEVDCAVISTEPKAHKIYLDYFISHKIPCLTDKPIVAREGLSYNKNAPERQYKDVLNLSKKSLENKTRILVLVQRREHVAYKFIFKKALEVVQKFGVPISYFHIYHSDGTWNMPDDFNLRENHPYKYGYGKLMHSGYHFIDLVAWIAEINKTLSDSICITTESKFISPNQQYNQINGKRLYKQLFNKETDFHKNKKFGEVDCYSNISMFRCNKPIPDNILSYGTIDLLQSGFSKRAWFDIAKDTYKGNGRLRHESINLNVGPLCNIQLHSYQSNEVGKSDLFGVGGEEHLDVYVFRNSKLIGGKDFEIFNFGENLHKKHVNKEKFYIGQNELSRHVIFRQLINNDLSSVSIDKQLLTNRLLASFYKSGSCKKLITNII